MYQKTFVILISVYELNMICIWGEIEPPFLFSYIVTLKVVCPVMTNISLFFTVKGENFAHSRIFKDLLGPVIFFCQFQDFPGFSRTVATLHEIKLY